MPLRIIPDKTEFNFMRRRWLGFIVSAALTLISLGLAFSQGLNWGIDFTGGILMEIRTEQPAELSSLRSTLNDGDFGEVSLQTLGSAQDVLIRIQTRDDASQEAIIAQVKTLLTAAQPGGIEYRKLDYVGPTVGKELVKDGMWAVLCAFAVIMIYIWVRFEWQYGVGAILALIHDATMLIGFFAVTRFEFGLAAIAAVLTVVGYSINDSVVIYDRIRENMRRFKKMPIFDLLNVSINDTLSRTILTAGTTLLAALALALFGGSVLEGFGWAIAFGVAVGTYSSIYISAPTLYYLNLRPLAEEEADARITA